MLWHFRKKPLMREGKNEKSNTFEMDILDEGVLYKALKFTGTLDGKKLQKIIYEVIEDRYFKHTYVEFLKEFVLK